MRQGVPPPAFSKTLNKMHLFTLAASESCSNPHVLAMFLNKRELRLSARFFLASAKICTFFKVLLSSFCIYFLLSNFAFAQDEYFKEFEGYRVYYSVFSSTAVSAEIAQRYGLVRGKDRVLVNIAVVPGDKAFGGVKAAVSGTAKNLIQQEKALAFQEIEERDAVYYLAPLRHTDREVFHFSIQVNPEASAGPFALTFTKELFINP